jgi:putative transposase
MARPLRIEYPGAFYHVTARGNERKRIFFAKSDYDRFKTGLKEARNKFGFRLHCYVLMTNHYHLLMETPEGNMSKVMHYVNASYTNSINRKRGRVGHLLQGRYKAILIERESYLLELSRYIHLNPVRAGVVERPEAYPYSSYGAYAERKEDELLSTGMILEMIGGQGKGAFRRYREFVERAIGEKMDSPLKKVYGGVVLGGKEFIRKILETVKEKALGLDEISHGRQLRASWTAEAAVEAVAEELKLGTEEVLSKGGLSRSIAIYLMKKYSGISNRQIGELCGGLSHSAVAKAHQRFSLLVEKDRYLRERIGRIARHLSHINGLLPK